MSKDKTLMCKGIGLLLMLFHHLFHRLEMYKTYEIITVPFLQMTVAKVATVCKVCVAIFVFCTGYGCAKSNAGNYKRIIARRYFKLMQSFWIIYFFGFVGYAIKGKLDVYGTQLLDLKTNRNILLDITGLSYFGHTPTINAEWWYMSLALLFIFTTPFMVNLIERNKYCGLVCASIFTTGTFLLNDSTIKTILGYEITLLVGIMLAKWDCFEKLEYRFKNKRYIDIVIAFGLIITNFLLRGHVGYEIILILDGLTAVEICYCIFRVLPRISLFGNILKFIGKHSMNCYLLHTFFCYYFFEKQIYSFKYFILIWGILLLMSLIGSIAVKSIKKVFVKKQVV